MARDMLSQVDVEKGETRRYKGQEYVCEGLEFIDYPGGGFKTVINWTTACAVCGERVAFARPIEEPSIYPARRCKLHKRPGARV